MSGNRVEKLEAKVRELEATVEGLTDELVETKERLGAIEDETGVEPDALVGRGVDRDRPIGTELSSDDEPATGDDEEPTADGASEAEGEPTEAETESDEGTTDSESGDDIIVA
jgi:hypothetical protein